MRVRMSILSVCRYCQYHIGASGISFSRYIDIVSVTSDISVIYVYFVQLFVVNLKTNYYTSKIEYLIWHCGTSLHL